MEREIELQGRRGAGAFQWNRGGWFGSQIGSTLWLVLLGALLLAKAESVGALLVALGLAPNLIGLALWRRRFELAPYPAIQALLAACGASALVALLCLRRSADLALAHDLPSLGVFLTYPGLMLVFHLQESRARKAAS